MKKLFLDEINNRRSQVASGQLAGFQPAKGMPMLKWDAELAKLAELNVKQCEMKYDECRSTKEFPYAGQNLAVSSEYEDEETTARQVVEAWFSQHENADMSEC
jgi:Cysteine-rich secretory protein family